MSNARTGLRVLVAEDNATNQKLVFAMLDLHGHKVTLVSNGKQASSARSRNRSTWS
jgi:CheY-like chemotaxis protein